MEEVLPSWLAGRARALGGAPHLLPQQWIACGLWL